MATFYKRRLTIFDLRSNLQRFTPLPQSIFEGDIQRTYATRAAASLPDAIQVLAATKKELACGYGR